MKFFLKKIILEEKEITSSENMKKNRRISTERKELSESSILPEQVLVAWGTRAKLPKKGKGLLPRIHQADQAKGHWPGSRAHGLVGAQSSTQAPSLWSKNFSVSVSSI